MRKKKSESYFWTSYSDLMTSLFFVMLVLFVLVVALLHQRLIATETELDAIKKINQSIEQIDTNYFQYDTAFQRHTLVGVNVSFNTQSSNINDLSEQDRTILYNAGIAIQNFMRKAQDSIPNVEYLLIVEGQASRDGYLKNYELSYARALSLVHFWSVRNITFDDLPCEVIISGSGVASRFRVQPDVMGNKANQRFVIHIIPKPGNIKGDKI